ncbi:hypothetical protein ACFO0N_09930 [Halobium salinum]|uniref:Uncharacterized protein n=1 Tax=Halobium salinum TaxID=1364940 RepID=A0ABD5PCR5_9EURY|nr:hypothetical protein [Halobium salinum]
MLRLDALLVCLLVVLTGCVGPPSSTTDGEDGTSSATATATSTTSPTPTPQPRMRAVTDPQQVDCGDASLAIYGASYTPVFQLMWDRDVVNVGGHYPANRSLLFVVTEGDAVLGVAHWHHDDVAVVDGNAIELDRPLYGDHTIQVTMYEDRDGDAELDPETDVVCTRDGTPVRTDPVTVDFDEAARNDSATPV